ncbi:hypothetical protein SUGI_0918930 [Cryptomeria japonica]|nr:hypothetical protein SUGI_0918930 [Cryptomeria japonica]
MTEIESIHAVASTQGFSKGMIIGEGESHKMEKETFLHGTSSDDRVTQQSSNVGNLGKENLDEQQENSKVIADKLYESKLKRENNLIDDKQKRMPSYQRLTHSGSLKTGNSLLAKSGNMSCQSQNSRLPKSVVITTKSSIQSGKDGVLAFTNKGSRAEEFQKPKYPIPLYTSIQDQLKPPKAKQTLLLLPLLPYLDVMNELRSENRRGDTY